MTTTHNMTEGNSYKLLLRFFVPMLFTNLLQQVYSFADSAIVGKGLGDNAFAAIGNLSSLTLLIVGFSTGITAGFSVILAQKYGSNNLFELRKSIANSLILTALLSVLLTAFSLCTIKTILSVIKTPDSIFHDSLCYGSILLGGLTATMAYNLLSGILRALGDSKTPFLAIMVSSLLNILLDCFFLFVLHIGVAGAAIATVLSQAVSAFLCFRKLTKLPECRLTLMDFRISLSLCFELMKNGISMACMNSVTAVGCMLVQTYVNGLGVAYTSAYSACNKYINFFMLPSVTAGFALSAFIAQNYGAKKQNRIREGVRFGVFIALISYLILGLALFFFPKFWSGLLLNETDTILLSARFLHVCGGLFLPLYLLFVYRSTLQGMGKPFIPMCSGILEMLIRILTILLFLPRYGFIVTAYAEVVAWIGALLLNFATYLIMMKKHE